MEGSVIDDDEDSGFPYDLPDDRDDEELEDCFEWQSYWFSPMPSPPESSPHAPAAPGSGVE